MPTFQKFEDMEVWQKSRELTRQIYSISRQGAFSKDFGLCDQIRRASTSIMSNIAEGFERSGSGEFGQFLSVAKGSAGEVKSQLYVAVDQNYIDKNTFDKLFTTSTEISKMLGSLMSYMRKTAIKGVKFKKE